MSFYFLGAKEILSQTLKVRPKFKTIKITKKSLQLLFITLNPPGQTRVGRRLTSAGPTLSRWPHAALARPGLVLAWPPACGRPAVPRRTTEGCWERRSCPAAGRTSRCAASSPRGWMEGEKLKFRLTGGLCSLFCAQCIHVMSVYYVTGNRRP